MDRKNNFKKNLLCVDLESWVLSERLNKKNLSLSELRNLDNNFTKKSLDYLLKTLKEHNQKITIFLIFKLEEMYPGIIERILKDGHEVGWHGHSHATIGNVRILKDELEKSSSLLKRYSIKGYQAPRVHFIKEGYSLLRKHGFIYSSSIYGNSRMLYKFDGVYEIPVSVSNRSCMPQKDEIIFPSNMRLKEFLTQGIPFGSSMFWGLLGKNYYVGKLNEANSNGEICNLFIHNWQLVNPDSLEYKKDVSFWSNPSFFSLFTFYRKNVSDMFEDLLSKFEFGRCIDYIKSITE